MAGELDALTAQVTATEGAETSAVTLIQGLAAYIAAHANDPGAMTALATRLQTGADALAAAVAANPVPGGAAGPT